MSGLTKARVIVAGGGALGSTIALRLAWAGARVTLADPADPADSASGVAAGMLAPAFESVLDPDAGPSFATLKAARDLWPALAERLGEIGLRRSGAVWVDLPEAPPRAAALTAAFERLGAQVAPSPTSGFPGFGEALFTPEDWRLDPAATLRALRRAMAEAGVEVVRAGLEPFADGQARFSDGARLPAEFVVIATGARGGALTPELARLIPIKGQILKYPAHAAAPDGPAIRCALGYAVGGADGLSVGATMEVGRADLEVDPEVVARLRALAERLHPALVGVAASARAGVRAASPDGAPLIGASAREGIWLAAGARRNGWLLAPLAAEIIAAELAGRDAGPYAAALSPRRLGLGG